ncbi:MAG: hypothetical protein QXO40_02155 [Candidatus Aenigmatarchaeota archaeon]
MNTLEEIIRNTLIDTGIITFIVPSLLFMTLIYVFLTRSKIVESKSIAGIISFFVFLLVLIFPIISGINISIFLSTFFVQMFFLTLIFLIGLVTSSIFYSDFSKALERFQRSRSMIVAMIVLAMLIFVTSGMLSFLISTLGGPSIDYGKFEGKTAPTESTFTIALLVLLVIFAVIIVAAGRLFSRE